MIWQHRISAKLEQIKSGQRYRVRQPVQLLTGAKLQAGKQLYDNFSANDYLGLSQHPEVINAWQRGAAQWGAGSAASAYVTGYNPAAAQLESELGDWLGYPSAILFNCGYAANQALLFSLMAAQDRIIIDKLSHASIQEAALLSPATLSRYRHNDLNHLQKILSSPSAGACIIVSEGVFSMDGDKASVKHLHQLSQQSGCLLMIDDAHGIGIEGQHGQGSCQAQGVRPDILLVTFGKAFGVSGAAIMCRSDIADYLIQTARHLIYSTALPGAQIEAIRSALHQVKQGDELRRRLAANIRQFREGMQQLPGYVLAASDTPIQPIIVGDNNKALRLSQQLRDAGCWITAIRPPTVPVNQARLRVTLSAVHTAAQIERLLEALYALSHQ